MKIKIKRQGPFWVGKLSLLEKIKRLFNKK